MNALKQQIVEAFEQHVKVVGFDKTTLDEIARDLRISKKTIYVHFDGKRDIYSHVVARQAQHEKRRLAASVASLVTFAERLDAVLRGVLTMARAHVVETTETEWLHEYEIAADAFRKATGDLLRELVQGGMDEGEFRAGDASFVEKMVTAMTVEYLLLVNADPSYDRDSELVERVIKFVS